MVTKSLFIFWKKTQNPRLSLAGVSADFVTFLSFLQSFKNWEAIRWRIWKKLKKFHAWRSSIPNLWESRVKINSHSRQLRNEIVGIQEIDQRDKWIWLIYFQYQSMIKNTMFGQVHSNSLCVLTFHSWECSIKHSNCSNQNIKL